MELNAQQIFNCFNNVPYWGVHCVPCYLNEGSKPDHLFLLGVQGATTSLPLTTLIQTLKTRTQQQQQTKSSLATPSAVSPTQPRSSVKLCPTSSNKLSFLAAYAAPCLSISCLTHCTQIHSEGAY